jgi:HD superfamily phosphohydrolase
VASLIDPTNYEYPLWQKNLPSSQLDVDRLDYLRRDSFFTGAGYGHFDWYRILHTFELNGPMTMARDLVWMEKAALAIEEYVFARYYMYWNVYLHKTTRGFEKIIQAMWQRARQLRTDGIDVNMTNCFAKRADMSPYDFVHLTCHALGGEIKGRTKLQKTDYFLGVLTDSLPELGYRPHFYGPYSAEVAGAVGKLRARGFVDV